MKTKISRRTKKLILLGLGVIAVFPLTAFAATNIGTNISTTGNLTINGNIQFTSGAAAGRFLASDALGNATWATLPAETDPVYSASSWFGTTNNATNWDTAFGWGNHALAGYLTAETDPVYSASSWFGTTNNATNWDTAFGWGNHALAGYLTAETDPLAVLKATFTTNGDLLYGTGAGTYNRLGVGANGQCLTSNGTTPVWGSCGSGSLPAGTTNNSTLRYDSGSTAWLENTGVLANTSGQITASSLVAPASSALTITGNAASTWSTTAGNLILQAGSGIVSLGTSTNLTASGALTVDSNTTSALNIGTGANAKTITIGNSTGATNLNILAGTGNITIGSVDTTGTLLVLDTKTDVGDPTGTNGAMYYNSNTGKFRCYEAGAWENCIVNTGNLKIAQTIDTSNAYTNVAATEVTIASVSITPDTATGDVLLRGITSLYSSNNTDQNFVLNLETGNNCTGTVLATTTYTITSSANTYAGHIEINAAINNSGATVQSYSLCASTATGDTDVKSYQLIATVIDNGN